MIVARNYDLSLPERTLIAHNVETDADVGATFHLEPNHQPRAGENTRVWFALTRQGGTLIPLEHCNCQLTVYDTSTTPPKAILQPNLNAIDVERYRGIPAANFEFPTAGVYELELKGTPKNAGEFQIFRLSYPVIVSPGSPQTIVPTVGVVAETPAPASSRLPGVGVTITLGVILILGSVWWWRKRA